MRFIKGVTRELLHEIENLIGKFRLNSVLTSALQNCSRTFAISSAFSYSMARRNRSALPQGETSQHLGNLHHLFLIQHYAISGIQDMLQAWVQVVDLFLAVFTVDEIIYRTSCSGPGRNNATSAIIDTVNGKRRPFSSGLSCRVIRAGIRR